MKQKSGGDLPGDVEEDGTADIGHDKKFDKLLHEKPVLTDRNGVVEDPELNENKTEMSGNSPTVNRASHREPVENSVSDSEDNGGRDADENEDLSEALSKCSISDKEEAKADAKDEEDIVEKISNLSVGEETETNADGQFIEIKSSDIKTLAEIEQQKRKDAEGATLNTRGPTGGVATNYCPNDPLYNQRAQKSYPLNVSCPVMGQPNYDYVQQHMYGGMHQQMPMKSYTQMPPQFQSKRGRDEFDEQPIKYTRPGEEKINNLNDPSKNMSFSNVVSTQRFCGGQVTVQTPEEDIQSIFGGTTTSGEFEFNFVKDNTYLQCGQNLDMNISQCQGNQHFTNTAQPTSGASVASHNSYVDQSSLNLQPLMENVRRPAGQESRTSFSECDGGSEGYGSDAVASPYSDQQDSPANNEQSMYSPPPSNISTDSGACTSMVPSPGSQLDMCSPRSTMSGYDTNTESYSSHSPYGNISQGNVQNIPSQQYRQVYHPTMTRMDHPMSPPSNVGQVYPVDFVQDASKAHSEEEKFNEYITENLVNLKDVMETIAHDMIESEQSKQKKAQNVAPKVQNVAQHSQNVAQQAQKVAVLPQQRPLSAPQPPNPVRPVANVLPNQMNNMIPVTSAPVYYVGQQQPQKTLAPAVKPGVNVSQSPISPKNVVTPVTTSQILVIPAQPQPQPAIVIVAPPMQPPRKAPQYRPIQPKIQPNPVPGKVEAKQESRVSSNKPVPVSIARPEQPVSAAPPVAPVQPAPRPKPANQAVKTNINQLNIARRLVATMTTDDLKFTDKDGDTFLHVAVCKADKYMVQALLERLVRENLQSMIDTQNNERQTPVYLAVSANQPEMVQMFNKYGADVNLLAERVSSNGQKEVKAAIHSASSNGREYLQTLKALLQSPDLNLNMFNSDGCTALHCAILEHNQPRHVNEENRESILDLKTDSKPILEALIKAGADPNAQDKKSGKTAFMYALETRDYSLVETLLGLVDITKVRSYFRTQAFDGSTCVKIMESRKSEFPQGLYERLSGMMSNSKSFVYQRRVIDVQ